MNSLLKKLGVIVPLVAYSLFPNYSIAGEQEKKVNKYEFNSFGEIPTDYNLKINQMRVADIDGDGDLDIIIGGKTYNLANSEIIIIENKMPQKNKSPEK